MRISDWSSDVCSSDLYAACRPRLRAPGDRHRRAFRSKPRPTPSSSERAGASAPKSSPLRQNLQGQFPALSGGCARAAGRPVACHLATHRRDDDSAACDAERSEEHTSELQSLMRISYAVFCLKTKQQHTRTAYTQSTIDN